MPEHLLYIAVAIQILYYGMLLLKIFFARQSTKIDNNHHLPVSVIICARNESENLRKYLPRILEQDHPGFEVVVVNDASSDDTLNVLKEFEQKYKHLKLVNILPENKTTSGKKGALQSGISAAQYPYLLMTDADCYPKSNQWIRKMTANFSGDTELILGIAPYENKNTWLDNIVAYETITTMIQYVGYALWNIPYMGVGRNIAYTRSLFNKVGGFGSHLEITSGDDDLFVQEAVKHTKTVVCQDIGTYMYSLPPDSYNSWWNQKTRHYATGGKYQMVHHIFLGLFIASKLIFYMLLLYLICFLQCDNSAWICSLLYFLMLQLSLYGFCHKYSLNLNFYKIAVLDLIYIIALVAQGAHSKLTQKATWK